MKWFLIMGVFGYAGVFALQGAAPGDQVVVVYNSRVPESKAVAEYYAQKRQVPVHQIFGFDLSTNQEISRAEFRDSFQQPLAQRIADAKLWRIGSHITRATATQPGRVDWLPLGSKIRYAVLCYGVPIKIASDPNLKEEGMEKLRPEMRRNEAAVDSELSLLPLLEEHLPLSGPLRNPLYAATNSAQFHPTNGVLMVSRLDGPSAAIARGLVDKAIQAETDGLWGRAYFDLRNTTEPGYKMGDDWIHDAAEICKHLGFETVVDDNPGTFQAGFPMSNIAIYMGWYDENVSGPFTEPTVEFMPGAFAYHLHSFSAADLRNPERFWTGPLLAKGATITMGCVNEPYLAGTPELAVFAARFFFNGMTFGEAAYASQPVLSWQTTVVGDPLYRPFGKNPDLVQDELQQRHSKLLEWAYLRLINVNLAMGKKTLADAVTLLQELPTTSQSPVLSEKLGDLYLAQGKPSSAVHTYAQALKLGPSPQARIRLLLTLGERLAALDRPGEACEQYQMLLRDFPNYPQKSSIYQKLLALAQKLHNTAEIAKYQAALGQDPQAKK
ncbi:MAG TPA: TIGR03790 family protein [Verrucomicrobiae bacterium]|nr:TIGR03790 family protein [Verrucomicrobiae bacterium]